jgi:hypothetical protein
MILYKYAGDSGLKILEDLRLKVTPPNEFNDPFEITPNTRRARPLAEMIADVRPDSKVFRGVYDDMVADGKNVGSFSQFLKDLPTAIPAHYSPYKKLSRQEMIKRDLAALDDVSLNLGVLCFSKPRANIPMWAYYGNDHQGVAIGINVNNIGDQLSTLATFIVLGHQEGTINSMTLGGLALVFSRLIDNSVVVLENIFRHLELRSHVLRFARQDRGLCSVLRLDRQAGDERSTMVCDHFARAARLFEFREDRCVEVALFLDARKGARPKLLNRPI